MSDVKTEEIVVKRQSFDKAMHSIEVYAKKAKETRQLDKVSTNGGFLGLGSHKVTGEEFNNRLTQIGGYLIDLRNFDLGTLDIVSDIYKALDALDKEHISGILIAANSAKVASDKANKNVEAIEKIIMVLQKFKNSLEKMEHLMDVDKAWGILEEHNTTLKTLCVHKDKILSLKHIMDVDSLYEKNNSHSELIGSLATRIENLHKVLDEHSKYISDFIKTLDSLMKNQMLFEEETNKKLSSHQTYMEQKLKESKIEIQNEMTSLNSLFARNQEELNIRFSELSNEHKETLESIKQQQAETIDNLRKSQALALNNIEKAQNEKLEEISKEHTDVLSTFIQSQNERFNSINSVIEREKDALRNQSYILNKKIKIAYIIAGSTTTITIIQIILNLLGVI